LQLQFSGLSTHSIGARLSIIGLYSAGSARMPANRLSMGPAAAASRLTKMKPRSSSVRTGVRQMSLPSKRGVDLVLGSARKRPSGWQVPARWGPTTTRALPLFCTSWRARCWLTL